MKFFGYLLVLECRFICKCSDITSFDFLSKNLQTIEADPHWYPSYFGYLAILNVLSLKTVSAAVLFVRSLLSEYAAS